LELHDEAPSESLDKFNQKDGGTKVLLASFKAKEGINVHDMHGGDERSLIMMTPPVNAVDNLQAYGRVWRLGAKSFPRIINIYYKGNEVDMYNASILATKMKLLGSAVEGEVKKLTVDPDIINSEWSEEDIKQVLEAPPMPEGDLSPHAGNASNVHRPGLEKGEPEMPFVNKDDIKRALEDLTGATIRSGRGKHKQKRAAGWYRMWDHVIRNEKSRDLVTSAHEAGHALQNLWPETQMVKARGELPEFIHLPYNVKTELEKLGRELYGDRQPNGGYAIEGWAEYWARYWMSKWVGGGDLAEYAPMLTKWLNEVHLPKYPEDHAKIERIREMYDSVHLQGAEGRARATIGTEDVGGKLHPDSQKKGKRHIFRALLWDDLVALGEAVKKRGITDLKPTEDPYFMASTLRSHSRRGRLHPHQAARVHRAGSRGQGVV
jgi:hypothetical protein